MTILNSLFFFIIAIGVLVTFHEFGHYWVARRAGVKVLRFSVGFGTPLLKWTRRVDNDVIEYVIAAIPLGGYVKMLDEREGRVSAAERSRAFNAQPLGKRAAIVVAGPLFNFILAIFFYWLVLVLGSAAERPLLGEPTADSLAAQSGFVNGDEVLSIGESNVDTWNQLRLVLLAQGLEGGELEMRVRDASGAIQHRVLDLADARILKAEGDVVELLGFKHWWPELPPVVGGVTQDGAAKAAGLLAGDRVLAIDGASIAHWEQMVETVRNSPSKVLEFVIVRDGAELTIPVIAGSKQQNDETIGYIGAYQEIPQAVREKLVFELRHGVIAALPIAVAKTWDMSWLTLRMLGKMLVGDASLKNISGPITIAKYAGVTAQIGLTTYISFLAIISLSLGVLNLLPVPMLDGGHLLYYLIELVKGSPVSEGFELRGQQLGMLVLALLMSVALFNDFQRLLQ